MADVVYAYHYDNDGNHYDYVVPTTLDPYTSEIILPADCVDFAPDEEKLKTAWAYLNEDKNEWLYYTKPTTAAECMGIVIPHVDQCPYAWEARDLFRKLAEEDSEHYRVAQKDGSLDLYMEEIPEKTIDEVRTEKLQEVESKAGAYQSYNCKELYVTSSLGFKINADQCSQKNMEVLISLLPDDETTTTYKIYDNTFKELNRVQLATMKVECEQNGISLYQQKFALQAKVKAAASIAEIKAIEVVFTMMDFSKAE